jgi:(1->4)-alpha-D-glucan 1-alpha-D-glucosylmutase
MLKATREAKVHTEWIVPDLEYENGVQQFIEKILDKNLSYEFFDDFLPFQQKVAWYGLINSLSQCLLKMTSPGLPDFYQGTELWDLTLVDPDNRNAVDFEDRRRKFHEIKKLTEDSCVSAVRKLFSSWEDGRIKMFLIIKALHCRNDNQELFREGKYWPLDVEGEFRNHIVAFARTHNQKSGIVAVPRLVASIVKKDELPLGDIWKDTHLLLPSELENQLFYNAITEEKIYIENKIDLNELFTSFPGALIVN